MQVENKHYFWLYLMWLYGLFAEGLDGHLLGNALVSQVATLVHWTKLAFAWNVEQKFYKARPRNRANKKKSSFIIDKILATEKGNIDLGI